MKNDLSAYSTHDLLRLTSKQATRDSDLGQEALQCLIKRWRDGIDLEYLAVFLDSDTSDMRLNGAYYLTEAVPRGEAIIAPVIKLARDPLPACRRAFVTYILSSGFYNEEVALGLSYGLFDFDHSVRVTTIHWAVYTSDERFDHFSRLVESGSGATDYKIWRKPELKRALMGLGMARRLRAGESVAEIRKSMPEEDSFTFDRFQVFEKRIKDYINQRKNNPA